MTEQKCRIFRQQALDWLSNPEQLDKLMQVERDSRNLQILVKPAPLPVNREN